MPQPLTSEAAMPQLETIVAQMERGELDIDSLAQQLTTAKKLIALCEAKLTATDEKIKNMLAEK